MFDQMSMPVLFTVLISTLAVVSIGVFIAVRVLAERVGAAKPTVIAPAPARTHPAPPTHPVLETTQTQELD